ncbi:MAG: PPOX class F420-dependent oxidoreductase [Oscillochloris sp.]|nr:PPOX class F420-dependent oxidoreductase [Oscillochloris sp.]
MSAVAHFRNLQGQQYMNLITIRKSGAKVSTPVWFAVDGDRCYVVSQDNAGKVKRIRNNPQVEFEPSDGRGQSRGPSSSGRAVILDQSAAAPADNALRAKYGWMYRAFGLFWRVRRITAVYLEIREA